MDFGKIFSKAIKYPLNLQVFLLLLVADFIFFYFGFYLITLINPVAVSSLINLGAALVPLVIVGVIASVIITIFLMALYIDNAAKYFSGKRVSLSAGVATAKKKFPRLLGTYILMIIILLIAALPMLAFSFAAAKTMYSILGIFIGLAILSIVSFFVFLAPYIAVLVNAGVFGSIKASIKVVSKHKLNMFIFWTLYLIIGTGLGLLSVAVTLGSVTILGPTALILQILITTYTNLFAYSAFTNFYLSIKK